MVWSLWASRVCTGFLVFSTSLTLLFGFVLSSSSVSADNDTVIDDVSIRVQASCTLSGTGMNSHVATVNPGTYETNRNNNFKSLL